MLIEIEYDPIKAFTRLRHLPFVAFLDSARFHAQHGRYSFLAADPRFTLYSGNDDVRLQRGGSILSWKANPWEALDGMLSRFRLPREQAPEELPAGAAIGYLGYNMGGWLENLPSPKAPLLPAPDSWFGFYDVVLAFDHLEKRGWLISSGLDESGSTSRRQEEFRRDQFLDELQTEVVIFPNTPCHEPVIQSCIPSEIHQAAIRKALDYIRTGDIYQVNLAHPFTGYLPERPDETYLRLRACNPAPFGAYLDFGPGQVLSSSPERFLKLNRRKVQTRPIKGTCARTGVTAADWKRADELLRSAKNGAELLMITDLLRNDLGRVAEYGSVRVPELVRLEEYETVYHLTSTVEASLRPDHLHLDALSACFPGGSITGAPKLRSMEIIHELEPHGRGIYTGSIGYFGFNGVSDFNIAIRTLHHQEGNVCFHVGGGIVADSDPAAEYQETLDKAQGMLRLWKPGVQSRISKSEHLG